MTRELSANGARTRFALGTGIVAGIMLTLSTAIARPTATNGKVVRIGFVTDLSGPYEEVDGKAGAEAIRMAIADAGGTVAGRRIELVVADHRNDPALARKLATEMFGRDGVDALISGVNSNTSLAMAEQATAARKPFFAVGAGTTAHVDEQCSPYVVQYAYNTAALSRVVGLTLPRRGLSKWYLLSGDYPFGRELESYTAGAVRAAGGAIVGTARNPHSAPDFTPYLAKAGESGATVLGLGNGHVDLVNAIRTKPATPARALTVVGLLTFVDDIHAMGLDTAQGLYVADSWYWTRDAESRAWAQRFFAKTGRMPSSLQAADYSAVATYLKAFAASGDGGGDAVMRALHARPIEDMYAHGGTIRGDGTMIHDMHLLRVKSPRESAGPWDYYVPVAVVPGATAFPPQANTGCGRPR